MTSAKPPSTFNVAGRIRAARRRLAATEQKVSDQAGRLRKQARRLERLEAETALLRSDFARIEHQLGALEAKVERLSRSRDEVPVEGDPQQVTAARDVLEAVRREHEQVRTRFQAVTRYEERLRRLEDLVDLDGTGTDRAGGGG